MNQMLGLKYIGDREEGISLMLYRSYKTISVSKRNPYQFTPRDNVSQEARNYYESKCRKLGIRVIDDASELVKSPVRAVRTQKLEAEIDKQVDVQKPVEDESQVTGPVTPENPELTENSSDTQVETGNASSEVDISLISEMSDAELSEYLDINFNKDQLKGMISAIGAEINVGRKSESTLINELVSNYKNDVVSYLSK